MEDVLGVALGPDAGDRKPGGLRFRTDDGKVLADERVQEGGLADVGGAGEGDVTSSGGHSGS